MSENNTLKNQLRLAAKGKNRSLAAKLNDVFDEVENAISQGVRHDEIVALLINDGLDFTLKSFRNTLFYLRKKKAGNKDKKTVAIKREPTKKQRVHTLDLPEKSPEHAAKDNKQNLDLKALSKLGASTKRTIN